MNQTSNRRTMTDALQPSTPPVTPEALSLIKAGTPTPQKPNPLLNPSVVATPPAEKTDVEQRTGETNTMPQRAPKEPKTETVTLVSVNYRLPSEIPTTLLKASADRKLKRIRPYTQQDIVAEALTEWFKRHGYMK